MALQQRSLVLAAWLAASAGLASAQTSTGTGTDTGAVGTRPTTPQVQTPAPPAGTARGEAMAACAGIVNANLRLDCERRHELLPDARPGNLSPSATEGGLTPGVNGPGSTDMSPGATSPGMPATPPAAGQSGSGTPPGGVR